MTPPPSLGRRASETDQHFEPVAAVMRGYDLESLHRGVLAVVDNKGRLIGTAGDPNADLLLRSSAKPFQALALVESGAVAALSITDEELALMCGSHSGRAEHVRVVSGLLARLEVPPIALVCGGLKHMCSGKHAGMIALAKYLGVPAEGYELPSHPVQRLVASTVASLLGSEPSSSSAHRLRVGETILAGTDGCGVPVLKMTVQQAAYLYAQLAAGTTEALAKIRDVMVAHPQLVAGEGLLDTNLMRAVPGGLLAKSGAEGIQGIALLPGAAKDVDSALSIGCVMKIQDGASRAYPALSRTFLAAYGLTLPEEAYATRVRTAEALRGLGDVRIEPVVSSESFRRNWGGEGSAPAETPEGPADDKDAKMMVTCSPDREYAKFFADQWPLVDKELFGRALDWRSDHIWVVVRRKKRMLGLLRGHFVGDLAHIDEFVVAEGSRRRGFGRMMLERFEEQAIARGCKNVVLRAVKDKAPEAFYHAHGYRRECVEWSHEFGYDYVRLIKTFPKRSGSLA